MKTFLIIFSEKQNHLLSDVLLKKHIDFIKKLHDNNHLIICGPFTDNQSACLVIKAISQVQAEDLIKQDPFLNQNYYQKFVIHEFIAASANNNWLVDSKQTKDNLQKYEK